MHACMHESFEFKLSNSKELVFLLKNWDQFLVTLIIKGGNACVDTAYASSGWYISL